MRATPFHAFEYASAPANVGGAVVRRVSDLAGGLVSETSSRIHAEIYTDLAAVEGEWRQFEQLAEATPFQTFEWLSAWQRHIGARNGVMPVIVVGRLADGKTALILPLAIEPRRTARRLCWLGQELCDYNAPLLARDFSRRISTGGFVAFWRELRKQMQSDPQLRYDLIEFTKMPETVGVQSNPFTQIGVTPNASSAHSAQLGDDWETYYRHKRSSATRRRDRVKRKHMSEFGEIHIMTAVDSDDVGRTLATLWEQKERILARKGVADIFAQPGYREFFLDFTTNPQSRHLAHVSRVEIGTTSAATNFGIVFGDCYYHILSSYCDGQLAHYGPGALHLRELLQYAIKRGLRRFDFTIGDEQYKSEWCDLHENLFDYCAAVSARGVPVSISSALRRRLKRFIKQTPPVWRLALKVRSVFGKLSHPQAS